MFPESTMGKTTEDLIESMNINTDFMEDADFRTLSQLVEKGALGDIKEVELHYDFESPSWMSGMGAKFTPGSGMSYGLGMRLLSGYHGYSD
jgi:predicted dehydrogenase